MKKYLKKLAPFYIPLVFLFALIANSMPPAIPPSPAVSGLTAANAVAITGGAITGITNLQAGASNTAPILFGNTTPIATITGVGISNANPSVLTKDATIDDGVAVGDLCIVTSGTNATAGQYRVASIVANTSVTLDRQAVTGACADGVISFYKDVVTISSTDGTNGQMISGWSHQNKPLQLGGSSLITSSALTRNDVLVGGNINVRGATSYSAGYIYLGSYNDIHVSDNYIAAPISGLALTVSSFGELTLRGNGATRLSLGAYGTFVEDALITSGSGTGITVDNRSLIQQVYKVTTTYAAYTDSDLTKGIVIATLPAKTRLVAAYADTTVAYAGTDITAATLEVGVTAEGAAEILATHNVFAAPILVGELDADMGTGMTRAAKEQGAYMPSFTGTTAVYATIDATTGAATTLADLTAGSTTFYLITERLP